MVFEWIWFWIYDSNKLEYYLLDDKKNRFSLSSRPYRVMLVCDMCHAAADKLDLS